MKSHNLLQMHPLPKETSLTPKNLLPPLLLLFMTPLPTPPPPLTPPAPGVRPYVLTLLTLGPMVTEKRLLQMPMRIYGMAMHRLMLQFLRTMSCQASSVMMRTWQMRYLNKTLTFLTTPPSLMPWLATTATHGMLQSL